MGNSTNKILAGLLIGSPATILMLGLLLNAYGVGATTNHLMVVGCYIKL